MQSYEALGSFYLGREVDPATGADRLDLLLYDSRDLTTHAVCVGMTGSGKTGLCISLLEEAAIDGIPAIAIDPKGDIGNLLLAFPDLQPADFAPWVDAGEAARKGLTPEAYAAATAETWRKGLADWQQDGERIRRYREAAEVAIYTPGSTSGRPLSILRSLSAPSPELLNDAAALAERVSSTIASLLALVGIDADPVQSREHILMSAIVQAAWSEGRSLDLATLIQSIQKPGFDKIGVFDLETFYPAKERLQLAMRLNNLLASPGFATWMEGEPLDVQHLLYTPSGKPRIAVISIAHLNDAERMFVVTLLLGEVVAWMRRQSGTSSLRALLYMDEIFGYFPPTAMPPSKQPLLTLMKQARAFGLGVVLATQNPVDLDYKGLSNAGTWFIGRLQTERDKARLIEGLLSSSGGADKQELERLLANLGSRVFLMRNVHDDAPVLFRTRWALSYLRGPLTLAEIARLQAPVAVERSAPTAPAPSQPPKSAAAGTKPIVPAEIDEYYLDPRAGAQLEPHILGTLRLHFIDKSANVDVWQIRTYCVPLDEDGGLALASAETFDRPVRELKKSAPESAQYANAPSSISRAQSYAAWSKQLASHAYEHATLEVWRCPLVGATSTVGMSEGEFRAQATLALREKRDEAIENLRRKFAPKMTSLEDQIRRARERVERERSQLKEQKVNTALSVGTSILGALLGRKKLSATNVGRVGSAARSAGKINRESEDVARAEQNLEVLLERQRELEADFAAETERLRASYDPAAVTLERVAIKPKKTEITVQEVALLWKAEG
jgi:hypothetical protein